jgi:hypothetical protein
MRPIVPLELIHAGQVRSLEEIANASGAFGLDAAAKVRWCDGCGEGYLKASPDIRHVGVLVPDRGGEALQHKSTNLIGKQQADVLSLAVEPPEVQPEFHRRPV